MAFVVPGSRARIVGFVATIAALLATARAEAAPTARLVYSRAADATRCPDEAALRRAVAGRVGYDAFFPWAQRTIVVAVTRRDATFTATVALVDEGGIDHGAHELHTDGACGDLLDAVALAVAIAIDPRSVLATPSVGPVEPATLPSDPPPPPQPPPLPPPLRPSAASAPTTDPVEPRHRLYAEATLGGVATLEMAPTPSAAGVIGVAVGGSRFSVGIEGLLEVPTSARAKEGSGSARVGLALGAVVPCLHLGRFSLCGIAQLGVIHAAAENDATTTQTVAKPWVALGGRLAVALPLTTRLSIRFHGDLLGDVVPTSFTLNGPDAAWSAPIVAGALGIDGVVRFW